MDPVPARPAQHRSGAFFQAAARLKPGITIDQAKARLQLSANEFRTTFPTALQADEGFSVTPFQEAFVQNVRSSLWCWSAP